MKLRNKSSSVTLVALLVAGVALAEGGSGIGKDITARVNAFCDSAMTILNTANQMASIAELESDTPGTLAALKQGLKDAAAVTIPGPAPQPGQPPVPPPVPLDTAVRRAIGHTLEVLKALEGGTTQPVDSNGPSGPLPPEARISADATVKYLLGQYGFIADLERTVDRPIFNYQQLLCPGCAYSWASAERRYQYFVAKEIGAAISREVTLQPNGEVRILDLSKDTRYRGIRWVRETQIGQGFGDVMVSPVESAAAFLKIAEYTAIFAADDLEGPVSQPTGGANSDGGSIFAASRCAASDLRNLAEQLRKHNSGDPGDIYRHNDVYAVKIARDVLVRSLDTVIAGCRY
jgi:hypothetical protein